MINQLKMTKIKTTKNAMLVLNNNSFCKYCKDKVSMRCSKLEQGEIL